MYLLYECVRGHVTATKPSAMDGGGIEPAGEGGQRFEMIHHVQQRGRKPVRHENHGGCIQSAPNPLLKQIQLS